MTGVGVVARFEVAEGNEAAVEQFFRDGRATVDASQPDTTVWFAFRIGPTTYGAFAWFADDEDRQALLSAGGPKAARENAGLFVRPPTFEQVDVLADRQTSGTRTARSVSGELLHGQRLDLRPLVMADAADLLASIDSDEVWSWKPVPRPTDRVQMERLILDVMIGPDGDRCPFAIVNRSDTRIIGSTTLHSLDPVAARAEIGWTWLARSCWGQGYNEEVKLLLLQHCFEALGLQRVEFTVDDQNRRSQRALRRMGFEWEGRLRSTGFRVDGSRRDTLVYGVIADEWPGVRSRLQRAAARSAD